MPDFNFVLLYVELALAFFVRVRVVVAWCEMRQAYRHFRTDRIGGLKLSDKSLSAPASSAAEGMARARGHAPAIAPQ
jgi:predicted DNA-binding transcriptional regulator YafY